MNDDYGDGAEVVDRFDQTWIYDSHRDIWESATSDDVYSSRALTRLGGPLRTPVTLPSVIAELEAILRSGNHVWSAGAMVTELEGVLAHLKELNK